MLTVNCVTAGACVLYGIYVYRVLRHAEYHDLKWLWWRTKTDQTNPGATRPRETHPTSNPLSRIEIISDADLYEGARRIYSGEAAAKLVASGAQDEGNGLIHGHPGWSTDGSRD